MLVAEGDIKCLYRLCRKSISWQAIYRNDQKVYCIFLRESLRFNT